MVNDPPESPIPTSTPAVRCSASGVDTHRHERHAYSVDYAAERQHPTRAVAVGDGAGSRLSESPHEVLDREGQSENLPAPAASFGERIQEKPEARTEAVGN